MLAGSASRLLARGQATMAAQFPATISIASQAYACATSGIRRDQSLKDGGFVGVQQVSFWLPSSAFTIAGQPVPSTGKPVVCSSPASLAGSYVIDEIIEDPAGTTTTLICSAATP